MLKEHELGAKTSDSHENLFPQCCFRIALKDKLLMNSAALVATGRWGSAPGALGCVATLPHARVSPPFLYSAVLHSVQGG